MITLLKKQTIRILRKGFTLIEFVVILAIFSIMAGVALFNFSGFDSNISLTNLAHDIALSIRQAQVYGISATESLAIQGDNFSSKTRGVYFKYDNQGEAQIGEFSKTFKVFVDTDGDKMLKNESETAIIDSITVASRDRITGIELEKDGNRSQASTDVHITFTRPKPDASIIVSNSRTLYDSARITIQSFSEKTKVIEVHKNGQINIQEE